METVLRKHYTPGRTGEPVVLTSPGEQGLEWVTMSILTLDPGQEYTANTGNQEAGLLILTGTADISSSDRHWTDLGGRKSVFDSPGTAVYIGRDQDYTIRGAGSGPVEICISMVPTAKTIAPFLVGPDDVEVKEVGSGAFYRQVHNLLAMNVESGNFIIGETYTPAGSWSSFPPHKHDIENPPTEVKQEEVYFFRIDPPNGFGIQWLYTSDGELDQVYAVRNNDVVAIPKGYHPVGAPPGYAVYYLWCLVGQTRLLVPADDPEHAWIKTDSGERHQGVFAKRQ